MMLKRTFDYLRPILSLWFVLHPLFLFSQNCEIRKRQIDNEYNELEKLRTQARREIALNKICSICKRTKSQIEEDESVSFEQHVQDVQGKIEYSPYTRQDATSTLEAYYQSQLTNIEERRLVYLNQCGNLNNRSYINRTNQYHSENESIENRTNALLNAKKQKPGFDPSAADDISFDDPKDTTATPGGKVTPCFLDPKHQREIWDDSHCLCTTYSITVTSETTQNTTFRLFYTYQNTCGKYIINSSEELSRLIYEGDSYAGTQNLAAVPKTAFTSVTHTSVKVGFSEELIDLLGAQPPFTPDTKFCHLVLAPHDSGYDSGSGYIDFSVPFFPYNQFNSREPCISLRYDAIDKRNIKKYDPFIGIKRKLLVANNFVRISYQMTPTGKTGEGGFFGRGDCKEPYDEYRVDVFFENVSGMKLRYKNYISTETFGFIAPQYQGAIIEGGADVPAKPTSRQLIKTRLPEMPNDEVVDSINTFVHRGVPENFLPNFEVGDYYNDFYADTTYKEKPTTFFAYGCNRKEKPQVTLGKMERIDAYNKSIDAGCKDPQVQFKSNKRYIAVGKGTNGSTFEEYNYGESDESENEAKKSLLEILKGKKLLPSGEPFVYESTGK